MRGTGIFLHTGRLCRTDELRGVHHGNSGGGVDVDIAAVARATGCDTVQRTWMGLLELIDVRTLPHGACPAHERHLRAGALHEHCGCDPNASAVLNCQAHHARRHRGSFGTPH